MSTTATVGAVETDEAIRSLNESFERIFLGARRVVRESTVALDPRLAPAAWPIFMEILRGERVQASAIVAALGTDKSAVSRHIKDLRELGLIDAERDEQDARVVWLTLTDAAREKAVAIRAARQAILRERLEAWDPEELDRFAAALERFSAPD